MKEFITRIAGGVKLHLTQDASLQYLFIYLFRISVDELSHKHFYYERILYFTNMFERQQDRGKVVSFTCING